MNGEKEYSLKFTDTCNESTFCDGYLEFGEDAECVSKRALKVTCYAPEQCRVGNTCVT